MAIQRRGIANPADGFSSLWTVIFWLAVFGAGGYGVYWCIGTLKHRADSETEQNAPKATAQFRRETSGVGSRRPPPGFIERQAKPELDRAAAEINLLVLAKEAARLKDDTVTQM